MPSKTPALVIRCQKHPTYTGLQKPRVECYECKTVHAMRGSSFMTNDGDVIRWGAK